MAAGRMSVVLEAMADSAGGGSGSVIDRICGAATLLYGLVLADVATQTILGGQAEAEIHQATGMVSAQLGDVVARRLRLESPA